MNTPVSTPRISAFVLSMAKGESQENENVSAPPLASATTANRSSAPTWAKIMKRWMCADSSVPSTQIVVITPMISSVKITFAAVESRRPSAPNRSNV